MRQAAAALCAAVVLAVAGCGGPGDPGAEAPEKRSGPLVRLGTKNFTEQFILGELYRQALEARGFRVQLKADIGSSEVTDAALTLDSIDMYPEYIGIILSELAGQERRPRSARSAYRAAKRFQETRGYTLTEMTPFADSDALAVKPEFARRQRVRTIADLGRVGRTVQIAAPPEFRTRFEGLIGLRRLYGLRNLNVRPSPIGKQYERLDRGEVDAAAVFTTDGHLDAGEYTVLRDPKGLYGFQNLAPVVSQQLLEKSPGLREALDAVSERLTTEAMREMNAAVDLEGQTPAAVAKAFLRDQGLLARAQR